MPATDLETRIKERGRALFAAIAGDKPSFFSAATWTGGIMTRAMANEEFKVRLFRFVDVFPSLKTPRQISDHFRQYFGDQGNLPSILATGASLTTRLGPLGDAVLARGISANIHEMARQFIIGETTAEAVQRLKDLHQAGFAAVVDVLGEASLSDNEADRYAATYHELLASLAKARHDRLTPEGGGDNTSLDWGTAPRINIAVKPTALFPPANPMDFEGSVAGILERLRPISAATVAAEGFLCIDMESYRFKDITLEVYRRLKREQRDNPHLGIVLQAYLTDTEEDLDGLLAWAKETRTELSIRLVKGAYWDYETVRADQTGWQPPVRVRKADTDAAFERLARTILENHPVCHFACASHNIRSIAAVLETARAMGVPESRYEFQMLYGMAEPVRRALLREAGRVRLYCPYGPLVPGMGYLVRRLLENSANQSFLRLSFDSGTDIEYLLADPAEVSRQSANGVTSSPVPPAFANEPAVDFARREQRGKFPAAIREVRSRLGLTCPLFINGRDVRTGDILPSTNPANPAEIVGQVCQAGGAEVEAAVTAARTVFPAWRDTPVETRAGFLRRAAAIARSRIFELAAWQVLEIGKQWDQAHADVAEAIDFFEYYADEMVRLGRPHSLGTTAGEINAVHYEPRGVAAVIAPWNFPLAISTGMCAASIVAGNPVVYKPSGLTGVVGYGLVELFREAGLPSGVFNYLPGRGGEIGDTLVGHPGVDIVAFTGSKETGSRIMELAARVRPGQKEIKKVVCEMGGKNAIIIDEDADLDEAVPQVMASAFGFQGQKCSACSRVITLPEVHERFVERLIGAARTWRIGPAEDPVYAMGAVADQSAADKIARYLELGMEEGKLLYQSPVPKGAGHWVPLAIFGDIRPEHRLAQEEIFGPVLAIMAAADFNQAIEWATSSSFALTGGIFSRSPAHISRAEKEFRVGNLYINRAITGAMVGRQPFGGFGMSGGGTKAGGPEYLLHFLFSRVITENTLRRGFAPGPFPAR